MSVLKNLKNHIDKKNELSKLVDTENENIRNLVSTLTMKDVENLSYEEMKSLYNSIHYLSTFDAIRDAFVVMMESKKALIYPEINNAYRYPMLNSLNLPKDIIKKLDETLSRMRVGDYIMTGSSLWRPLRDYVECLVPLGIVERYYELICPEIDDEDDWDYKEIVSETNLDLHKKVWKMYAKLKDINDVYEKGKLYEEINKLEVDGYGCICMCDYEITNLEEFEKTEKNVRYKVIMAADRTLDKV